MVPPPSGPLERRAWVAAVMARVAAVAAAKGWELLLLFSDEYFKFVFFVCLWILFVFFFFFCLIINRMFLSRELCIR